ncbi:MAG: tetratricopeptide repeat protein [Helicobacteraceae bacterium]|jgi:tetratricopeptide (TPR) repeat protein|nr:tetratricopeptide repeat protein [Helicobacteraceae bacterium]
MRRGVLAVLAIYLSALACYATKPTIDPETLTIEYWTRQIESKPEAHNLYWQRGSIYQSRGDYENAIADYSKAIEFADVYIPLIQCYRGDLYFKYASSLGGGAKANENYEKAIADYSAALAIDNSMPYSTCDRYLAYMGRGASRVALGRYEAAIEDYKGAIEAHPDFPHAYRDLANIYIKLGDYYGAIESYSGEIERARPFYPASPYIKRAELYELVGEYDKAISDAKTACEKYMGDCAMLKRLQNAN